MDNNAITLTLPPRDTLRNLTIEQMGYPDVRAVSERVAAEVEKTLDHYTDLVQPAVICQTTPLANFSKTNFSGRNMTIDSVNWTRLARRMDNIHELCCFAVTIGRDMDEVITRLSKNSMLPGFILDSLGSVLTEWLADQIQEQVARYYDPLGLVISRRFSPGYCDWPLRSGQRALFNILKPETIKIKVSDGGLMSPRKSITAVIIAAESMPASSPCFMCGRECAHRRAPFDAKRAEEYSHPAKNEN